MKLRDFGFLFLIIVFVGVSSRDSQARHQPEITLPFDIVYSTCLNDDLRYIPAIMRVDSQTLENTILYVEEGDSQCPQYFQPVSWSPGGRFLAFIRVYDGSEICIITRNGNLVSCMEEPVGLDALQHLHEGYQIKWSPDEQFIYYSRGEDRTMQIVKARVATGELEDVVYQHPDQYHTYASELYLTQDLNQLVVFDYPEEYGPIRYFSRFWPVPGVTLIELSSLNSKTIDTELDDGSLLSMCRGFFGPEDYLVARVFTTSEENGYPPLEQKPALAVFDQAGDRIMVIEMDTIESLSMIWVTCPFWGTEAYTFYFFGNYEINDMPDESGIFRYSLATGELTLMAERRGLYGANGAYGYNSTPDLTPDGNYLIYSFRYTPYLNDPDLLVLDPEGQLLDIPTTGNPSNPLWIPDTNHD